MKNIFVKCSNLEPILHGMFNAQKWDCIFLREAISNSCALPSRLRSRYGSLFASHPLSLVGEAEPIWTKLDWVVTKKLFRDYKCSPASFFGACWKPLKYGWKYKRPWSGAWIWKGLLIDQFLGSQGGRILPHTGRWIKTDLWSKSWRQPSPPKRLQEAPINVWCINLNLIHWYNHQQQLWIDIMVIIVMETIKNAALAENTGWHRVTLSLHESYGHQTVLTVTNMQWSKGCSAL